MTGENRQHNIRLELAEARDRLEMAEVILGRQSYKTAATLAYYSAFHYARALLLCEGLEARTHGGVIHLINLHFVRSQRLAPEIGKLLSDLQADRERAEYDAAAVFTEEMARVALDGAHRFAEAATRVLAAAGYPVS